MFLYLKPLSNQKSLRIIKIDKKNLVQYLSVQFVMLILNREVNWIGISLQFMKRRNHSSALYVITVFNSNMILIHTLLQSMEERNRSSALNVVPASHGNLIWKDNQCVFTDKNLCVVGEDFQHLMCISSSNSFSILKILRKIINQEYEHDWFDKF